MANRPLFVPDRTKPRLVREVPIEFQWFPGFSLAQKQRSIESLHRVAAGRGIAPVLEISSASPEPLGQRLSAFRLIIALPGTPTMVVESAFQGSKVFEHGGPYQDLYAMSGREAKKDERVRSSGKLVAFQLMDQKWPLDPPTAFYDWLYVNALQQLGDEAEKLLDYRGFTDIAFNPAKSLNCQARSAALYVALRQLGSLEAALRSQADFVSVVGGGSSKHHGAEALRLFTDDHASTEVDGGRS